MAKTLFILLASGLLASCLPQENPVRDVASTESNAQDPNGQDGDGSALPNEDISSGISEINFFQQGASSVTGSLNIFSDFKDSFLLRGDNVHNYLKNHVAGTQKKLCMGFHFPQSSGNKVLLMGARTRSYYNSALKGKEYYLQMEVSNESANVNDCLNTNMTSAVGSELGSSSIAFKLADVCPACNSSLISDKTTLFLSSGAQAEQVLFNNLAMNIVPALGSGAGAGVTCQSDSLCKVEGFNCCLQSQCVNHGESKPGVDTTTSDYQSALEQILARPERISNYSEYFYVCPQMVPTDPNPSGPGEHQDPDQEADDLFTELEDLYYCLNPVLDEFSLCSTSAPIDLDNIGSGGTTLSAGSDDLTFKNLNSNLSFHNIVSVEYAGRTIYREKILPNDFEVAQDSSTTFSAPNDSLATGQTVTVDRPIPSDATKNTIKARYRVDGTCERLGANLAKCSKYYVQGQPQTSAPPRSSDHPSGNNDFKLPSYANFDYNIIVEVDGVKIPMGTDTWSAVDGPNEVRFSYNIHNNQRVKLTYFVTNDPTAPDFDPTDPDFNIVDQLLSSRESALERVQTHCNCGEDTSCNLKPVYETINNESKLVNYVCEYGQPDVPPSPLQKTVFISSKSAPHRYYDEDGVHYEIDKIGDAQPQEGKEFKYASENSLRPNNQGQYIGFNEIYGSFRRDEISAMPATVVDIQKGRNYDLFVDSGTFSSCLSCGTDYFSNLQKLFPGSFEHMGGGYLPDMVESRRKQNQGDFSGTDMKFGRACFVPATMIPWTHKADDDVNKQRRDRLSAQHFLFANGYNKDWYGFDYGSLIGSYDGVRWFSIGNQRRIQAKSNKLYLAINAYFGDLTIDNSFKITVSELSSIINAGSAITHDTESDGAQCQKAHYCSTDNDCMAQLGYEYTCQSVSGMQTPWPTFDSNGNEISGSTNLSLLSIVGGSNGQVKRCVYRGAGSLCEQDLTALSADESYNATNSPALHACSPNTHCAGLDQNRFNDRIARYGNSPATQNNQSYITSAVGASDTFGLGARLIGRPFDFLGTKAPPSTVRTHLQSLNAEAMCVPGKNPLSALNVADLNEHSGGLREADKSLGIGKTFPDYIMQNKGYYASCPATDENEIFTHTNSSNLSDSIQDHTAGKHVVYASAQNMSTNALDLSVFDPLNFFNDQDANVSAMGYNKGSCLRAPGSSCYSDMDCSPNSFISQKIRSLSSLGNSLSLAEQNFWKEELVCANSQDRYLASSIYPNPVYELNEHKCCRETGKDFTFASQRHKESDFEVVGGDNPSGEILLPGVNQSINSPERYSRTHTVYDKLIENRDEYPPLYAPGAQRTEAVTYNSVNELLHQYNTLHLNNSRMCCTGNWVRNFATGADGNNGGHKFTGQTQQRVNKNKFKYLSWSPNNVPALNEFEDYIETPFLCSVQDWQTSDCEIKEIAPGSEEETRWLNWFGKLELLGIPQVLVETNKDFFRPLTDGTGALDEQLATPSDGLPLEADEVPPLDDTVKNVLVDVDDGGGAVDAHLGGKEYYSAASYDNFEIGPGKLKKVFSEDSFSCCVPTGIEVDGSMPDSNCCTGQVHTEDDVSRCCLQDFADVSVYTNRYVSSEGAHVNGQPINENDIDKETGYIRKEIVLQMAANMCCSGAAAYGVAIGDYYIPLKEGGVIQNAKSRRWLYNEQLDNAAEVGGGVSKYNAGMKWNNHVYCVPPSLAQGSTGSGSGGTTGSGAAQD